MNTGSNTLQVTRVPSALLLPTLPAQTQEKEQINNTAQPRYWPGNSLTFDWPAVCRTALFNWLAGGVVRAVSVTAVSPFTPGLSCIVDTGTDRRAAVWRGIMVP